MRYGWRGRIGHIAPAILDTSAEEFRKLLPEGVLHVGLTISEPIQTLGAEQAASAFERMVDAGKRLAKEQVDVIVCGGAPVALSRGTGGDAELAELLRHETGLPVVTANGVVVEALRLFGA
jgi:maleate cis-trans isomerase